MKKMIIFSPGPANISERVRKALLKPDICHRDSEFTALLKETRKQLTKTCFVDKNYAPVIFTGSGTAAIEACISSLKRIGAKLLIISNGFYGERAYEIAKIHKIPTLKLNFPNNTLPDLEIIKQKIHRYRPDVVYLVHHETTTGLLNPLQKICQLANQSGAMVMVDAISSIAGEELKTKDWGIDVLIGSANKCIRGTSGLSFAVISKRFIAKLSQANTNKATYYLDLYEHLLKEMGGQTPFTPAVHNFYAFNEALAELLEDGVNNRIKHFKMIAAQLRNGLIKLGLKLYVDEKISSNTMTTVFLPKGFTYEKLHKLCKKEGFCIYAALGNLKNSCFRLGTVGCINQKDIRVFLNVLSKILYGKVG